MPSEAEAAPSVAPPNTGAQAEADGAANGEAENFLSVETSTAPRPSEGGREERLARLKRKAASVVLAAESRAQHNAAAEGGEREDGAQTGDAQAGESADGANEFLVKKFPQSLLSSAGVVCGRLVNVAPLFGDSGLLAQDVLSFLEECCAGVQQSDDNAEAETEGVRRSMAIFGSVGTLVSRFTKAPIHLPVMNPCSLSEEVSNCVFDEAIPPKRQKVAIEQMLALLLGAPRRFFKARQLPSRAELIDLVRDQEEAETETKGLAPPTQGEEGGGGVADASALVLVYSREGEQETALVVDGETADSSPEAAARLRAQENRTGRREGLWVSEHVRLGAKTVYRPKASHHVQIAAVSKTSLRLPPRDERPAGSSNGGEDQTLSPATEEAAAVSLLPEDLQNQLLKAGLLSAASPNQNSPRRRPAFCVSERILARCERWVFEPSVQETEEERPVWILELRRESESGDRNSHPEAVLEAFEQSATSETGPASGDCAVADADLIEESRRVFVRLYAPAAVLRRFLKSQWARKSTAAASAAYALVQQFLSNLTNCLAPLFDDPLFDSSADFFFPGMLGDSQVSVRNFYRTRRVTRSTVSPVQALRRHNNQMKRILIRRFVPVGARVLDLACGHGQDVLKFAEVRVSRLLGFDFSRESILEARRRVQSSATQRTLQQMLTMPEFHVGDVQNPKMWNQLRGERFDVVSIQLAIHYMVQTEQSLVDLIKRSAARLLPGGHFICSTVCCRALVQIVLQMQLLLPPDPEEGDEEFAAVKAARLEEAQGEDVYFYGNSVFAVFFSGKTLRDLLAPWGFPKRSAEKKASPSLPQPLLQGLAETEVPRVALHLLELFSERCGIAYHFWLRDTIDEKEFVFPFGAARRIAEAEGLECTLSCSFPSLLQAASADPVLGKDVRNWQASERSRPGGLLDGQQMAVFALMKVFAFRKVATAEDAAPPAAALPA